MVHVQDHMREMRRQIEQEKNQRGNLESKLRLLGKEKQDLFKWVWSLEQANTANESDYLKDSNFKNLSKTLCSVCKVQAFFRCSFNFKDFISVTSQMPSCWLI